jgi:hypothetical protein
MARYMDKSKTIGSLNKRTHGRLNAVLKSCFKATDLPLSNLQRYTFPVASDNR